MLRHFRQVILLRVLEYINEFILHLHHKIDNIDDGESSRIRDDTDR